MQEQKKKKNFLIISLLPMLTQSRIAFAQFMPFCNLQKSYKIPQKYKFWKLIDYDNKATI